jgi:hypothetical protein
MLGFDYKAASRTPIDVTIQNINSSDPLTGTQKLSLVGDNAWSRCEVFLTTNELGSITNQVLYIYLYSFVGELSICNLKFEKGSRATEWCPAPEDVIGDFPELTEASAKAFDVVEQYVVDHPKKELITIADMITDSEQATYEFLKDINGNPFLCKEIRMCIEYPTESPQPAHISFGRYGYEGYVHPFANSVMCKGITAKAKTVLDWFAEYELTAYTSAFHYYSPGGYGKITRYDAETCGKYYERFRVDCTLKDQKFPIGTRFKLVGVKA